MALGRRGGFGGGRRDQPEGRRRDTAGHRSGADEHPGVERDDRGARHVGHLRPGELPRRRRRRPRCPGLRQPYGQVRGWGSSCELPLTAERLGSDLGGHRVGRLVLVVLTGVTAAAREGQHDDAEHEEALDHEPPGARRAVVGEDQVAPAGRQGEPLGPGGGRAGSRPERLGPRPAGRRGRGGPAGCPRAWPASAGPWCWTGRGPARPTNRPPRPSGAAGWRWRRRGRRAGPPSCRRPTARAAGTVHRTRPTARCRRWPPVAGGRVPRRGPAREPGRPAAPRARSRCRRSGAERGRRRPPSPTPDRPRATPADRTTPPTAPHRRHRASLSVPRSRA